MGAFYVANKLFEQQMKLNDEFIDALYESGKQAAAEARSIAPVVTGAYKRSIWADRGTFEVTVGSHDPFGHMIEWGSINNEAYAPIRRGVLAAGLRLDEK
jgi:hypothetical protein